MFASSLSVSLSSVLLWLSRPCRPYRCLYLSRFQLCRWSPGRRCEMCGRECSRKGSMFWASGFSGVDAGGSWVKINPPMLTAVSVAWRLVYQASRHWRHLSVSRVTTPINKGNTLSYCVSKQYYWQLCAPEVVERVSGLRRGCGPSVRFVGQVWCCTVTKIN
jgi:hypothetical protein